MPIKKIELSFHPSNPLNEIIADVNENFDAIIKSFDTLHAGEGVVGPRGDRGEKGEAGVNGVEGPQGVQGERGLQGEKGPAGQDGKDGINGTNGTDGLPGVDGKDGQLGAQGIQGLPGKDGKDGLPGPTGPQGVAGPAGIQGPVGLTGPVGVPGAMNQKQYIAPTNVTITAVGQTVLSTTFTSTGSPVLLMANGDANPINGGAWCRLQWFRNGTAVGKPIQLESGQANVNVTYAVIATDTPPAGTQTYSLQTTMFGPNSFQFGETDPPVANFIELTGATGPTGPGINNTVVQNSITLGATTTAPAAGTRTIQRIESQTVGDKVRLTYKFGQVSTAAGSGDYLLTLPAGMTFNTTYNPVYTGALWQGGVNPMAPYFIATTGGIVIDGNWTNQVSVVPYDSTRFRLAVTNNVSQGAYNFWSNGFYATNAGSGLNVQLQFEIWK